VGRVREPHEDLRTRPRLYPQLVFSRLTDFSFIPPSCPRFHVKPGYLRIPDTLSLVWIRWTFFLSDLVFFSLAFWPANLAAMFPYSIEILADQGIRLGIPFRKLSIPIHEVVHVTVSSSLIWWRKSYEVEISRYRGLVRNFYISPGFGNQRNVLVEAIRPAVTNSNAG